VSTDLPREAGFPAFLTDLTAGRFITKTTKNPRRAQRVRDAGPFVFFVNSFVSFVMNLLRRIEPRLSPG